MKSLKHLNTFAISLPIALLIIGTIINDAAGNWIGFALFSTMLTGLIQLVLGLALFFKNTKNRYLKTYLITVILFFLLLYVNIKVFYSDIFYFFLYPIPLILAIYFSLIIYKKLYL